MANVLIIGDTHCPGMRQGYVDFLQRVADCAWQWVEDGAIWLVLQNDCPHCPCGPPEGVGAFDGLVIAIACAPGAPPP